MTSEAYLIQVLVPALMAVAKTILAGMMVAAAVVLLGALLVAAWKSPRSVSESAFDKTARRIVRRRPDTAVDIRPPAA
jgi:hypothetical protein